MICLTIVLVLGRPTIVESLELIVAPRLHSVSNRTTHFRVLLQADTYGGRDRTNIVSIISSVAYLLELIVRTFRQRNSYIRTVGGCFRGIGSEQSCRSELYSCNEWNGASNDSHTDIVLQST